VVCCAKLFQHFIDPVAGTRIAKNIFSDIDSRIKEYEDKFKDLKSGFQDFTVLQTRFLVQEALNTLNHMGEIYINIFTV
jgi:hypothetical protein